MGAGNNSGVGFGAEDYRSYSVRKLCVVYNIFGGSGRDNHLYYLDALRTLTKKYQDLDDYELVVSGVMINPNVKMLLQNEFRGLARFVWMDALLPVNVTFNHAVNVVRRELGDFEGYVYVDSGINFHNLKNGLSMLYGTLKEKGAGIVAADPNNDKGYEWIGLQHQQGVIEFKPGWAMCAHVNVYSHDFITAYGRILPDVFQNDCSESVHTFLTAGFGKFYYLDKRVTVFHLHNMDGGNAFRGKPMLYNGRDMVEIARYGRPFGLGFEECRPEAGVMHDPALYDADGKCVRQDELREYIKENLYLRPNEFDYGSIIARWV